MEGEKLESVAEQFIAKAKKVDKEILAAEEIAQKAIKTTSSAKVKKEFEHLYKELKKIEKAHKKYDEHAYKVIDELA